MNTSNVRSVVEFTLSNAFVSSGKAITDATDENRNSRMNWFVIAGKTLRMPGTSTAYLNVCSRTHAEGMRASRRPLGTDSKPALRISATYAPLLIVRAINADHNGSRLMPNCVSPK